MKQIYKTNSPVFIKVLNKKGIVKDYDSTLDQYFITYFNSKDKRESNWFAVNQLAEFKNKDIHARSSNGDKLVVLDKNEIVLPLKDKFDNDIPKASSSVNRFMTVMNDNFNLLSPDNFKKINEWFDKWDNDGNSCNKYEEKLLDEINEIESSDKSESYKKLAILSVKEELMSYVENSRPNFKGNKPNHINIIKTLPDGRPLYWTDENKKMLTVNSTNYPVVTSDLVYINPEDSIDWETQKVVEKEPEGYLNLHSDSSVSVDKSKDNHIKSLEKLIEGYKLVLSDLQNEKDSFEMVREFQQTFNLPAPDVPTVLSEETVLNRAGWTAEELIELLWSTADDSDRFVSMYSELTKRMEKDFNKMLDKPFEPENKLVNQADALIDQLYFVNGSLVELSIVPNKLLGIVHSANMSKLHNGKVVRNDQGKVVKPDGWIAPEPLIEKEIQRQVELGVKRFK